MNSSQLPTYKSFLGPKYWPTWFGVGIMWCFAKMPFKAQIIVGHGLGRLLYLIARRRRLIAETNLRHCFPELTELELQQLVKQTIIENAIGFMETASAWFIPAELYRSRIDIEGVDNLREALAQGRGVLLVGAHYTTLDLGGVLVSLCNEVNVMYRPNANPLFDLVMKKSRQRFCNRVLDRKNMREVIKSLKNGELLWYAPDQDYGHTNSVFAPFFGVQASTITATARLAKINQSPVVILSHHRNANNAGYTLRFSPIVEGYPSGDEKKDATLINRLLEQQIRINPAQYMWVHRRFKTRPEGEPKFYSL